MAESKLEYSIVQAIETAEDVVANPEVVLSQQQQVAILGAFLQAIKSSPCFYNGLKQGRKTFVLLEGDPAAPAAILAWADAAEKAGHQPAKVRDALAIAYAFAAAPVKVPGDMRTALNPAAAWPFPKPK